MRRGTGDGDRELTVEYDLPAGLPIHEARRHTGKKILIAPTHIMVRLGNTRPDHVIVTGYRIFRESGKTTGSYTTITYAVINEDKHAQPLPDYVKDALYAAVRAYCGLFYVSTEDELAFTAWAGR